MDTLVCLHFLGGCARSWDSLAGRLRETMRCVALDLPGFGAASAEPEADVATMANRVAEQICADSPQRWWIAGHSMGAKVALAIARMAENGAKGLDGYCGIILLAGSPPSPEPMDEAQRHALINWIDSDHATRQDEAKAFIASNAGAPLPAADSDILVEDVLNANPAAWKAWLARGSREDWCSRIGILRRPALIFSGTADADLGPEAQTALMAPHFSYCSQIVLEGAGHLLPIERPDEVAAHLHEFTGMTRTATAAAPLIPKAYLALIASDRVNTRLRDALRARAVPDDPGLQPDVLDPVELAILRAACDRILPQSGSARIDLAARIDMRLGRGDGDGWRHAALPPDGLAYRQALRCLDETARELHGRPFVVLGAPMQDALLHAIGAGTGTAPRGRFDADQMRLWFEDLRADVVRTYLAHPAALARLGYSGIGAGGDDPASLNGFRSIAIGDREPWEPLAEGKS